jgi:hypothetical protein
MLDLSGLDIWASKGAAFGLPLLYMPSPKPHRAALTARWRLELGAEDKQPVAFLPVWRWRDEPFVQNVGKRPRIAQLLSHHREKISKNKTPVKAISKALKRTPGASYRGLPPVN